MHASISWKIISETPAFYQRHISAAAPWTHLHSSRSCSWRNGLPYETFLKCLLELSTPTKTRSFVEAQFVLSGCMYTMLRLSPHVGNLLIRLCSKALVALSASCCDAANRESSSLLPFARRTISWKLSSSPFPSVIVINDRSVLIARNRDIILKATNSWPNNSKVP